jgi:4-amino-4-deoxy-L-arabinose transferase-like glycosyltransferase
MTLSWPNFLFGSFDPAGTITVDKIPGSYWVPALSARIFGFSTWSIELPNALATVAASVITAMAARRISGAWAGLLAGLIVGTTPVLIAVGRSNQPESFFVLGVALTLWASVRAVHEKSVIWLVLAGVFVGLAFQCYMLEAWAMWPALIAAYLCTRQSWSARIRHLFVAGLASLVVSLSWIFVVALVPSAQRPFIGSTLSNNPWEMVFGYNGLGRFGETDESSSFRSFTPPFSGTAGPLRLFNVCVAGQIAWLIPAAIVATIIWVLLKISPSLTVLTAGMFATFAVMLSAVAGMHQFYVACLAPELGILIGVAVREAYRRRSYRSLYAILAAVAITAMWLVLLYPTYLPWIPIAQALAAIGAIFVLARGQLGAVSSTWWFAALTLVALILGPLTWSAGTIGNSSSINPVAGPQPGRDFIGQAPRMPPGQAGPTGVAGLSDNAPIVEFVAAHSSGEKYALATLGAQRAAAFITRNGLSVLPIGGFSRNDDVPTFAQFMDLVQRGEVRFVLLDSADTTTPGGGNSGAPPIGGSATSSPIASSTFTSTKIETWVRGACAPVIANGVGPDELFDCAGSVSR